MSEKKIYEAASVEIVTLDNADVISTSGAFNGEEDSIRK